VTGNLTKEIKVMKEVIMCKLMRKEFAQVTKVLSSLEKNSTLIHFSVAHKLPSCLKQQIQRKT
jgi:hypothetical protein